MAKVKASAKKLRVVGGGVHLSIGNKPACSRKTPAGQSAPAVHATSATLTCRRCLKLQALNAGRSISAPKDGSGKDWLGVTKGKKRAARTKRLATKKNRR